MTPLSDLHSLAMKPPPPNNNNNNKKAYIYIYTLSVAEVSMLGQTHKQSSCCSILLPFLHRESIKLVAILVLWICVFFFSFTNNYEYFFKKFKMLASFDSDSISYNLSGLIKANSDWLQLVHDTVGKTGNTLVNVIDDSFFCLFLVIAWFNFCFDNISDGLIIQGSHPLNLIVPVGMYLIVSLKFRLYWWLDSYKFDIVWL